MTPSPLNVDVSEIENAIKLANTVLDQPYRDPDDDLSVLARQFLRARERIATLLSEVERLTKANDTLCGLRFQDAEYVGRLTKERDELREALKGTLREHWLTSIECLHTEKQDVAHCYCTVWKSEPLPNVAAAVDAWIDHVIKAASVTMEKL